MDIYIGELCPFKHRCPHGKECLLRGSKVFRCPLYWEFERRDVEELRKREIKSNHLV